MENLVAADNGLEKQPLTTTQVIKQGLNVVVDTLICSMREFMKHTVEISHRSISKRD